MQDLHNLRDVWGCCAAFFVEYLILINTTQEYDNWNPKLSQPCSHGESGADTTDEPGSDGGLTIEGPIEMKYLNFCCNKIILLKSNHDA